MSWSPGWEGGAPPSPASQPPRASHTSTPNYVAKKPQQPPLSVILPSAAPSTPSVHGEPATVTTPPRSPGGVGTPAVSGDGRGHPPDGTSSDKSSETAAAPRVSSSGNTALSRKESYKAQRQHYRREKKRAASALLHSIEDPSVVVLADWLKVRGSLKSWTKLWCVLKPGLLLLYKSPKAKSSHWVGTVLLTSCQVIERPSKKDGFCFKLYHPLEQSIWAPRGPHNETIGAVVQPLPTAHLIFRAPSQAAGHCWLDGLELALRCSNAMLRCSHPRVEQSQPDTPCAEPHISNEELEKHFNEHATCCSPIMSVSDYTNQPYTSKEQQTKTKSKPPKWYHFIESLELLSKEHDASSDETPDHEKKDGLLDYFMKKKENFERNSDLFSSVRHVTEPKIKKDTSKSLASSPMKMELAKKTPIVKCFDIPKLPLSLKERNGKDARVSSPTNIIEENLVKFLATFPKRRSSTPCSMKSKVFQKRISDLRESGVKTDSENDDFLKCALPKKGKLLKSSEVICTTPDNIIITKTAPSVERFRRYSSSSTDEVCDDPSKVYRKSPPYKFVVKSNDKYSLIDCGKLPSASYDALQTERRDDRLCSQSVYVAGKIVTNELAGAASDTDSSREGEVMAEAKSDDVRVREVIARIEKMYKEDPDLEVGQAGEIVEEVAEENKSLLWFLLKQVRPGMDLSKVVLPTFILEPRSFLDRLADTYYHVDMLSKLQEIEDPYKRFVGVVQFYLTGLYKKPKGLKKPYNPVLGETFRCCWKHPKTNTYTYYVAEQVSHHPPISAYYLSNRKDGFVIEASLLAKSKFYGNSISAFLDGVARLYLLNWDETYVTTAPYAHCKGIIMGTLSMELGGKVVIKCRETGYNAEIEFKLKGFLGGSDTTNALSGKIRKDSHTLATIEGFWDGRIDIKDKKTGEESVLVDVSVLKNQRLTRYLVKPEYQKENESQKLWVKVTEAINLEDQVAATEEKTVIEEDQRNRIRAQTLPWTPRYFHKDLEPKYTDGLQDNGWTYDHFNTTTWGPKEMFEYEEEYVIQSVMRADPSLGRLTGGSLVKLSDSDTPQDYKRSSKNKSIKRSLDEIDTAIRAQTAAIEQLHRTLQGLSETRRRTTVPSIPTNSPVLHLVVGFIVAFIFQSIIMKWIQ